MVISKIGAKVERLCFGVIQSRQLDNFFFFYCYIDFERKNLITKNSFTIVLSTHSVKYGHTIRYIKKH